MRARATARVAKRRARVVVAVALAILPLGVLCATRSRAQEFAPATPEPLAMGAASMLDQALAPERRAPELSILGGRPFGLAALDAAAVAAGAGWRSLRVAAGLARSGDPAIGWSTVAFAIGGATSAAGYALRVAARSDRRSDAAYATEAGTPLDAPPGAPGTIATDLGGGAPAGANVGGELGAGAWIAPGRGAMLWVAHPQLVTRGSAPPLGRGLECGVSWRRSRVRAWLARELAAAPGGSDTHRAGIAFGGADASAWLEARDVPLRAGLGLAARAGPFAVGVRVEAHPVLPQSVRFECSLGSAR